MAKGRLRYLDITFVLLLITHNQILIMDYKLEQEFQVLSREIEAQFGEGIDLNTIMILIGIQELGQGYQKFNKDEKINLMHIATCTILEPYGYYSYLGEDEDGWPHFEKKENIPAISEKQQEHLLKEAVIQYFKVNGYFLQEEE